MRMQSIENYSKKIDSNGIEYVNCNICGNDSTEFFFKENNYTVVKCRKCGLVYVNPRPLDHGPESEVVEDELYTRYIREYVKHRKGHNLRSIKILHEILKFKPAKGKLLEIGCAAGFFLDTAKKMGWCAEGLEPEAINAEYANKQLNLNVKISPIESVAYPENHFDVIVALNVLSHLSNPKKFFKKISSMLKNDGIFVFETGNKGAMKLKKKAEILGEHWLTPEHLYHFSESSLALLLKNVGFRVKSLSKTHIVDHLLSKGVLSLNRSTRAKWMLKRFLIRFDRIRTILGYLLKLYFIKILKADVCSLLYIVEKNQSIYNASNSKIGN
jgi:2-polyprenyl-3-methyl-5-hydroxy-6-metoxy-1,4-benzoquinol methylase